MSFSIGPCGWCKGAEIQMAVGQIFRVGIGGFIMESPTMDNPILNLLLMICGGPLYHKYNPGDAANAGPRMDDPLYCRLDITKEFDDGWKLVETITFDPEFQDMSFTYTYPPSQPPFLFSSGGIPFAPPPPAANIPAVDPLYRSDIVAPAISMQPLDPDSGHTYNRFSDATKQPVTGPTSVPPNTTTLTASWPRYVEQPGDPNNGKVHFGCKITYTLSNPKHFADYAALATALLDQITLQDGMLNPDKTYHGIGIGLVNLIECDMKLRYSSEMPVPVNDLMVASYTNFLVVKRDRAAGYKFRGNIDAFGDFCFPFTANWKSPNGVNSHTLAQQPLAANGMPYDAVHGPDYPRPYVMPVPYNAQYLFSVKSSVRVKRDLNPTCEKALYDPVNVGWWNGSVSSQPASGEHIFLPGDVGGIGYLRASWQIAVYAGVSQQSYNYDHPNGSRITDVAAGASITLYAVTADKNFNWVDNVKAIWSLSYKFGDVSDANLVVNPNGLSAVYTGPLTFGAVKILVTVPGTTSQDVYYFRTNTP